MLLRVAELHHARFGLLSSVERVSCFELSDINTLDSVRDVLLELPIA